MLNHQPHFHDQPDGTFVWWGYALFPDKTGDFVPKPMRECSGHEILDEVRIPRYIQKITRRDPFSGKVVNGGIVTARDSSRLLSSAPAGADRDRETGRRPHHPHSRAARRSSR